MQSLHLYCCNDFDNPKKKNITSYCLFLYNSHITGMYLHFAPPYSQWRDFDKYARNARVHGGIEDGCAQLANAIVLIKEACVITGSLMSGQFLVPFNGSSTRCMGDLGLEGLLYLLVGRQYLLQSA